LEPERGTATSQVESENLEPMPEVEEAFEGIEVDAPRVGIIMGSESDKPAMEPAGKELKDKGIRFEVRVLSAHRDPAAVADYARNAHMRGLRVIIAGAGMSAALPGVVAAHTDLPVIGVPIKAKNTVGDGLDALLSTVQMPPGVPVACVAINGARNAGVLAARILNC
jgi:phosphoribosylaminoimidazole carboxylase PurE protein